MQENTLSPVGHHLKKKRKHIPTHKITPKQTDWYTTVILATAEAEAGRSQSQDQPGQFTGPGMFLRVMREREGAWGCSSVVSSFGFNS